MNTRQRWLAIALIVTLAVAFWPAHEDSDGVVESTVRADRPARLSDSPSAGDSGAAAPAAPAARERLAGMQANLFPSRTWVPPPKPYVAPPPPPPSPPPLPFKYLGRWVDGGKLTLFLVLGEQPVAIQPGQVLSGSWRVDQITERSVNFTYLPLNMQSTLGFTP